MAPQRAGGPVDRLIAQIGSDDDVAFVASVLRTRSVAGRNVLARKATGGTLDDDGLRALGAAARLGHRGEGPSPALPRGIDKAVLAAYAHVLAVQVGRQEDRDAALGIFGLLAAAGHRFTGREVRTYAQLLLFDGQLDRAVAVSQDEEVKDLVRGQIATDRRNPRFAPDTHSEAEWLAAMNASLIADGLAPLALLPDGPTAFDRLTTTATTPGSVRGPLIAIIMSAFNPDAKLITAVRSCVEQTYADWELLIIDDASPAPMDGVLAAAEAMDPRVRVIRKAVNGGTYRARNTALRQTNAEFFTCLDSDDWAHPQRLERGVAPLLADPSLMVTRSMCVRADEDLVLTRPGHHSLILNAPSLMVRMHPAVARVGFFDTVRKAADTEYAVRLEAAFGRRVRDLKKDVLTMARHEAGSLSFGEFLPGWRHEARNAYRQAYGPWHQAIRDGADPFLDPDGPRRFVAPARWQSPVDPRLAQPTHFDVVLLDDFRDGRPGVASSVATLRACLDAGLSVGVLHTEDLWEFAPKESALDPRVLDLVNGGAAERIYYEDTVDVDSVVVPSPSILQFPPWVAGCFTPARVLVASSAPASTGSSPASTLPEPSAGGAAPPPAPSTQTVTDPGRFERAEVERHTVELFGVAATWVAAEELHGERLAGVLAKVARRGKPLAAERDSADSSETAWLTIRTRRPADGEHADALAVRYVAGPAGHTAAVDTARALLEVLEPGVPVTAELAASAARPGVQLIAQNLSGQVVQVPVPPT
ncbi:MAG TPA: glycosyltransferase family 2 protein [Tetrasphaera australiensis]|nr:glycosyltransferase family 2 protein [Tetrasphaera australiensis]